MTIEADRIMNNIDLSRHSVIEELSDSRIEQILAKLELAQVEMIRRHFPRMNKEERCRANLVLSGQYHGQAVV